MDGLCEPGSRKCLAVDIAHRNIIKCHHQPMRELVVMVLAAVGNSGVDVFRLLFLPSALGNGELVFKPFEVPGILNPLPC